MQNALHWKTEVVHRLTFNNDFRTAWINELSDISKVSTDPWGHLSPEIKIQYRSTLYAVLKEILFLSYESYRQKQQTFSIVSLVARLTSGMFQQSNNGFSVAFRYKYNVTIRHRSTLYPNPSTMWPTHKAPKGRKQRSKTSCIHAILETVSLYRVTFSKLPAVWSRDPIFRTWVWPSLSFKNIFT